MYFKAIISSVRAHKPPYRGDANVDSTARGNVRGAERSPYVCGTDCALTATCRDLGESLLQANVQPGARERMVLIMSAKYRTPACSTARILLTKPGCTIPAGGE